MRKAKLLVSGNLVNKSLKCLSCMACRVQTAYKQIQTGQKVWKSPSSLCPQDASESDGTLLQDQSSKRYAYHLNSITCPKTVFSSCKREEFLSELSLNHVKRYTNKKIRLNKFITQVPRHLSADYGNARTAKYFGGCSKKCVRLTTWCMRATHAR